MNDLNDTVLYKRHPSHKHLFCGTNGEIWSTKRSMFLTRNPEKDGYIKISVHTKPIRKHGLAHRLIAEAHIENKSNKPYINHINSIRDDNRVCNLEWVTMTENNRHMYEFGGGRERNTRNGSAKLSQEDALCILKESKLDEFNAEDVAKKYNVSVLSVNMIAKGKRWKYLKRLFPNL